MPFVKKQKLMESQTPTGTVVLDHSKPPTVKDLKHWQRESGRARERLEQVSSQLDDARQEYERISREAVLDEQLDAAAIGAILTAAHQKVWGLEQAVNVEMQRMQAAEVALANAGERAQRDELRKKLTKLGDAARAVDVWVDSGKPIIEHYHACRKNVLDFGYRDIATVINVANLSFQTYLFRTCAPMANCNTGYSVFQTDPRWAEPWSMSNPHPDLADTVKLT